MAITTKGCILRTEGIVGSHVEIYMTTKRIFISIASFCDPMLVFTVKSALEKACFPERLAFGIVDQSVTSIESHLPSGKWQMAYLLVDPHHSRGASWARALAMTLYSDEHYFLQIDSHTFFDRNWDITLVDTIETITKRSGNEKIIVSTRPFAFEIRPDGTMKKGRFTACTLKLVPKSSVVNLSDPVVLFSCENSREMRDMPGFQVSAAFLFTRGDFVEKIPYDPFMYFHGEEQNISIRAYTHGCDIWHPNRVPLYHLYKKREAREAQLHWDPVFDNQRRQKWTELKSRAASRLSALISGELSGVYGLGNCRSLEEYWGISGFTVDK